ncbi:MAG: Uma2 family endonuclease [Myxococcaceae bacterium]
MRGYSLGVQTVSRTDEVQVARMSLEDWIALEEDAPGEFIDGWLVEEEMASSLHEVIVVWLSMRLGGWVFPRGGLATSSNARLVLAPALGRKPDLMVFFQEHRPDLGDAAVRIPPDIAVEVVSSSARDQRRDRIAKYSEYAVFGVRYYWLLDPVLRTLEIFELAADGRYRRVLAESEGELDVPGCEGLKLNLSELWNIVDRQIAT